jgi:hypothetical protein
LVGWIIVQATWLEALRSGKVVPSRNTPFCPVELGIKPPLHELIEDHQTLKLLEKVQANGGSSTRYRTNPRFYAHQVAETLPNKFRWRTGFYDVIGDW